MATTELFIRKRDGRREAFSIEKIKTAIRKAFLAAGGFATEEELARLPGVGAVLSRRITEYREAHGPFASADELDAVEGVGPALRFALQDLVTAGDEP